LQDFRTESVPEPVATNPEEGRSGFTRMLLDILETLVLSVLLFVGINAISARIRVDGYSMEPTLHTGEFVIVNRLAYQFGSPKIGDVIVFHYPRDPQQEYIKRVIGRGGDTVRIEGGQVYVNGQRLIEPYIAAPPAYQNTWQVPKDSLFVLGDNRNNSSDSHNWGFVPMNYVVGKAISVYWPPNDWGLITHPDLLKATP
jgi:signal peptidase I